MKNIILKYAQQVALLMIFAGVYSSCERADNDPEKFRLVKKLYYNKSSSSTPTDGIEFLYDGAGNVVKESIFKYIPATVLLSYREYEYSGSNKTNMKIFDKEDDKFILIKSIDYIYGNGYLIREDIKNGSGSFLSSMNYEYYGGNKIREYYYEPDYGISTDVKFSYDSQNRLIQEEFDTSDVKDVMYIKHFFDTNNRKIHTVYYNLNWDLIKTIETVYNGRSKLPVKDVHYDNKGNQTLEYQHFYDKNGNLTETRLTDGCSLFKRKYDGGLLIEEISYFGKDKNCAEDEVARYEYVKIL
jgi:hypothetical protein